MNKNQKGIAHFLLLVLVLAALMGVGYWSYKNGQLKFTFPQNQLNTTPTLSPTTPASENIKTYSNTKYGFEFKYPTALAINSNLTNENNIELNGQNGIQLKVMVNVPGYSPPTPNKEFTGVYFEGKGIVITDTKVLEPSEMRDFNDNRIIYVLPQVLINDIQLDFIYQYNSPNNQPQEKEDRIFETILSTFKFVNAISEPQVSIPLPNSKVISPLIITGKVPAGWMFEGQFPIELLDSRKSLIVSGIGKETVPGSWTGGKAVEFRASLTFTTSATSGLLVLKNDNPSGLPENSKSFEIPISF